MTDMQSSQSSDWLLKVSGLKKNYPIHQSLFSKDRSCTTAVDGVGFSISRSETLGLVGESGSGKTTLAKCIVRAIEFDEGKVLFNLSEQAFDISAMGEKDLRPLRRHFQMIFQDPYDSLNPRMTIREIIAEPLRLYRIVSRAAIEESVTRLLDTVCLDTRLMDRFPHALSGGQRQRIGIARALALQPALIVCDEPVSALDVSVQAQILNLFSRLLHSLETAFLFVSHDLRVVGYLADRIAVMFQGSFVELAETAELFENPKHPYTENLLKAATFTDWQISCDDNPVDISTAGCKYAHRCSFVQETCLKQRPQMREIGMNHYVCCHYAESISLSGMNPGRNHHVIL